MRGGGSCVCVCSNIKIPDAYSQLEQTNLMRLRATPGALMRWDQPSAPECQRESLIKWAALACLYIEKNAFFADFALDRNKFAGSKNIQEVSYIWHSCGLISTQRWKNNSTGIFILLSIYCSMKLRLGGIFVLLINILVFIPDKRGEKQENIQ